MTDDEIAAIALGLCVDRGLNPTHAHTWGGRPSGHTNAAYAKQEVRVEVERRRVQRAVSRAKAVHFQERYINLPTYSGGECKAHLTVWMTDNPAQLYAHEVHYPNGKEDIRAGCVHDELEQVRRVLWRNLEP